MTNRYLPAPLRRALGKTVKNARLIAEEGARDAIRRLGVADSKAPSYLNDHERELRRRLRAHARALGDAFDRSDETHETKRLVEATAYAHWHRMLFARFLAERGLLRNPEYDVPVSLGNCRELAEAEGLTDPWIIAERYAASMLPAVFRIDDPVLSIKLDPVQTQKLHRLVTGLDTEVFQAEDSLGWTYQFWRAAEKDAVNKSGVKIGANELPAVTQLFTEPYMVRFLLHNTLGAWWAGKVLAADPTFVQTATDENELRAACSLPDYSFDMLRFVRERQDGPWHPAAGTFPGWPKEAKAITMLDPCCGSGHFLTEALTILAALRRVEEHLSAADAVAAVLRDNLHALEIDERCVQIAAFAVALSAWRIGGWQTLPLPHVAWVGAPPPLPKREFVALADGDAELEYALAALHDLFAHAPVFGTLLETSAVDLFEAERLRKIERLLEPLLVTARKAEPDSIAGVVAARGMADAASLLHRKYVLQATNVPYLGRGKQSGTLADFIERRFPEGKADLATTMLQRMRALAASGGTYSGVTPENWLFLKSYKSFRMGLLEKNKIDFLAILGSGAFETIGGKVVSVALLSATTETPNETSIFSGIDVGSITSASRKSDALESSVMNRIGQMAQMENPGSIIVPEIIAQDNLIRNFAETYEGMSTGDNDRYRMFFWEIEPNSDVWTPYITPPSVDIYSGRSYVIRWDNGRGSLSREPGARIQGRPAWEKTALAISVVSRLQPVIKGPYPHEKTTVAIVPRDEDDTTPLLCYLLDDEYSKNIRKINRKVAVSTGSISSVPFHRERWRKAAASRFPDGIPEPFSSDPTNWLFHGHPANTTRFATLSVGLARLCGHRWPAETDSDMHLSDEARVWIAKTAEFPRDDNDGLLGVPAVAGEKPLADRLGAYLAAVFGNDWSDALERRLVAEADETLDKKAARDGSLEAWARDRAFRQHCALFGRRPFLWHISDGLKDGFSVFVDYHRFDQANLRKLTYTLLGDWLDRAKADDNALRYEKGRELQQKLEKILEGEKPYDIFVRWKSLAQQPLGWDPDLDDGVRQNIRPFIIAGVLTHDPSKILKDKDPGKDVASAPWFDVFNGERRNDHHTTLAEKRSAREAAAERVEAAR